MKKALIKVAIIRRYAKSLVDIKTKVWAEEKIKELEESLSIVRSENVSF